MRKLRITLLIVSIAIFISACENKKALNEKLEPTEVIKVESLGKDDSAKEDTIVNDERKEI